MPAYLIVDVEVKDAAAYEAYKAGVPPLMKKHGGEFLVRGAPAHVLEGTWHPHRLVIIRFPNANAAQAFLNDPVYQPLKKIRHHVAKTDMVLAEGA